MTKTKTKVEAIQEIYDRTISVIVDSEIQTQYMKKQDPKRVISIVPEKKYSMLTRKDEIQMVDYTAEMLLKKEESKLKEHLVVLDIVKKKLQEQGEVKYPE